MECAPKIVVNIWVWSLNDPAEAIRLRELLTDDERARATRYVKPSDRDAYIVRRGRMREILGGHLGLGPAEVRFEYGPDGKPELPAGPEFSLSHSAGQAVFAVTDKVPVGIDIEAIRPLKTSIERIFTNDERKWLNGQPADQKHAETFRMWTRKEALSKALGIGVWLSAETFSISDDGGAAKVTHMVGDDPDAWTLIDLEPELGMPAHLAVRTGEKMAAKNFPDISFQFQT